MAAAALLARRWRLALELAIAGGVAWFVARMIAFVDAGDSFTTAVKHVFDGSLQPTYPTVPLAVMTAVILTAAPFLTRPVRRIGPVVLFLVAIGTFYRANAGFNAVFAAFVIGWGIAATLHLAFGSPAGRPTVAQVAGALDELGVTATNVRLAPDQARGYTVMLADGADGSTPAPPRVRAGRGRHAVRRQGLALLHLQGLGRDAHVHALAASGARGPVPDRRAAGGRAGARSRRGRRRGTIRGAARHHVSRRRTGWRAPTTRTRCCARCGTTCAAMRNQRIAHGALDLDHVVVIDGSPDDRRLLAGVGVGAAATARPRRRGARALLANALLVLGLAIIAGAVRSEDGVMRFHRRLPNDTTMLLMLVVFMIAIISTSLSLGDRAADNAETISVVGAILILVVYGAWLASYLRAGAQQEAAIESTHAPPLDFGVGLVVLALAGVAAAFVSEWFVSVIDPATEELGISKAFTGLVIVAIAGNAVENVVGIQLAWKRRYDLAISVVKNSVAQIAAFLYPALVLISLLFSQRLTFGLPSAGLVLVVALVFAALAIWQITGDGEAAAYEGMALVATYAVLATVVWFE